MAARKKVFHPDGAEKAKLDMIANEDPRLKPAARQVFKVLLDCHNPTQGLVFPSQETIAARVNCSVRWVRQMTILLASCGYIRQRRGKARNGCTLYIIRLDNLSRADRPPGFRFEDLAHRERQELERPVERNSSSSKLSNEHIQKKRQRKTPKRAAIDLDQIAKKKKAKKPPRSYHETQNRLAEACGGRNGWAILLRASPERLENVTVRLLDGSLELGAAATEITESAKGLDREADETGCR